MPMARSKRTGSKIKTAAGRMGRTPAFLNGTERTSEKADKAKFVFWAFCEVRAATTALPNGASLFALSFVRLQGHRRAVPK